MNWTEIDKPFQDVKWHYYPQEYCLESLKPDYAERFEHTQKTKDANWYESIHPFCKSCYAVYKEVCEETGVFFNLGPSWKKENLPEKVKQYILNQKQWSNQQKIQNYEAALKPLIHCLTLRWYQHEACFISTGPVNYTIEVSNPDHIFFLLILARQIKTLYEVYKLALQSINIDIQVENQLKNTHLPLQKDMLQTFYPHVANECRTIIKQFGNREDKKNVDRILSSSAVFIQNSSSRRQKKKKKQSRTKQSYRPPRGMVDKIIKEHRENKQKKLAEQKGGSK